MKRKAYKTDDGRVMVQVKPRQYVNLKAAHALGIVPHSDEVVIEEKSK